MTDIDPREAKLPVWAQRQLEVLRLRLREAEASLESFHAQGGKSRVWYGGYGENAHYLPQVYPGREQSVYFQLGDNENDALRNQVQVRHVREHDGRLLLDIHGGRGINIEPTASNCFRIALRD